MSTDRQADSQDRSQDRSHDRSQDRGTYVEHEGRPAIRFVRTYPHPVERVWAAVTSPQELRHWFPSPDVSYEPRVGAPIEMVGDPYAAAGHGTVLVWEPPHRFGFEWGDDELHFRVEEAPGGARFELVNVLDAADQAARNAAGWEVCLGELGNTLDDRPGAGVHGEDHTRWQPLYESYVAAGLPAGAEVPAP